MDSAYLGDSAVGRRIVGCSVWMSKSGSEGFWADLEAPCSLEVRVFSVIMKFKLATNQLSLNLR